MASITDFDYNTSDNMDAAKKPLLTDLRTVLDAFETYINDSIKDNLVQLALDCFPSGYAFDSDGAKNFATYDLYDKQTATDSDAAGNHAIAVTGAWTDVDATNASLAITPDHLTGDFKVTFQFNVQSVTSNAVNECNVMFRLTDGSTTSTAIPKIHWVTGVTTTTNTVPVTLTHQYNSLATGATSTVRLQYYITTLTATTLTVLANATTPIAMCSGKI